MLKDIMLTICILIVWFLTLKAAHEDGVEQGWLEYEAYENAYECEVLT